MASAKLLNQSVTFSNLASGGSGIAFESAIDQFNALELEISGTARSRRISKKVIPLVFSRGWSLVFPIAPGQVAKSGVSWSGGGPQEVR